MNAEICKNAMKQGYATLAHKLHCDPLPHTGSDLLPVVVLGVLLFVAGIAFVLLATWRRSA